MRLVVHVTFGRPAGFELEMDRGAKCVGLLRAGESRPALYHSAFAIEKHCNR